MLCRQTSAKWPDVPCGQVCTANDSSKVDDKQGLASRA